MDQHQQPRRRIAGRWVLWIGGSVLASAFVVDADLSGANLSEATPLAANLSRADLRGTDLSNAIALGVTYEELLQQAKSLSESTTMPKSYFSYVCFPRPLSHNSSQVHLPMFPWSGCGLGERGRAPKAKKGKT